MPPPNPAAPDGPAPYSRRTLALAVAAAALILLVVAFLPEVGRALGLAPGPPGAPAVSPTPPLAPVPAPGPQPAGPVIPRGAQGPVLPPGIATAPLRIEVRDADDRTAVAGASVELQMYGPPKTPAELPSLTDPATVAPNQRTVTELRNAALIKRSRPRLYDRALVAGADGVALFPGVPGGEAELVVTEREDRVSVFAVQTHAVAPGDADRAPIIVLLARATGRITGRVIDDTGAPKAGAEILVVRNRPPMITSKAYDFARRNPYHRAESGADGRFEMPGMPVSAKYLVHARLQGWGADSTEYIAVERAAATEVTLVLRRNRVVMGQVRSTLKAIDLTQARLVSYRVQDPEWRPGEPLRVSYQAGFPVQPDAQGHYRLEAPNTVRYVVIEATLPGHEPVRVAVDFGQEATRAQVEQAIVFARPGRVLAGRVTNTAGEPLPAKVLFVREDESLQHAPVETDAQGRFHADWLADALYTVVAEPLDPDPDTDPDTNADLAAAAAAGSGVRLGPAIQGGVRPDRTDLVLVCKP